MVLIAALFVLNVFLLFRMGSVFAPGDRVVIEVDQKVVYRIPLSSNRVIHVQGRLGTTDVEISDGRARILHSPCKNKICIKSGYIRYADRLLACIPNRVVVRVEGKKHLDVDAIVG